MPKTVQEDVMKSWAEAQHRLWDGWLEAMGHAGTGLGRAYGSANAAVASSSHSLVALSSRCRRTSRLTRVS